jgi:hypothetical protein
VLDLNGVAFMKERRERGRCFGRLVEEAEKRRRRGGGRGDRGDTSVRLVGGQSDLGKQTEREN